MESKRIDDHEKKEETTPALTSTPEKDLQDDDDPSLSIRRSAYSSDIENNDILSSDSGIPSIYQGSTTHGIIHVVDSTCKQPTLHIWLSDVAKLWPLAVNHYVRNTSYDTFTFTPFSSKENWDKLHPELKNCGVATAVLPDKKSTASNDTTKISSETQQSHDDKVVRNKDKLSAVIINILLFAFIVFDVVLLLFIRYVYAHDGNNFTTRMAVGGIERFVILFGEFMDGRHVWGISHVLGMIYAAVSGQSRSLWNSGQLMTDATCNEEPADRNIAYDGSDLIEWITSNGGVIHPNTRIGLDPTGNYRGVFVKSVGGEEDDSTTGGIEKDAIIAEIPWDLIIKPPKYYSDDWGTNCDALQGFYHEFQIGDESKYAPYINYLKNQPDGRIPSEWSVVGKKLLRKILDQDRTIGLPPYNALDRFEQIWMNECNGEDTPLARSAFFQYTSRDKDNLMTPFFDMLNHSNDPKMLNTISIKPNRKGQPFTIRATRNIAPQEQIFNSYNRCHPCWFDEEYEDCRDEDFSGTDHIFRQFGFVEQSPQYFNIPQYEEDGTFFDDITICLDRNDRGEVFVRRFGENGSDEEDEEPGTENLLWLDKHLQRLYHVKDSLYQDGALKKSMPSYEWDMAWTYHDAMFNAISAAFEKVTGDAPYSDSKEEQVAVTSGDDSEDDSADDIEMAFIEDVIAPVEDDWDWEDEPFDEPVVDEQPYSCMSDLDYDENEDVWDWEDDPSDDDEQPDSCMSDLDYDENEDDWEYEDDLDDDEHPDSCMSDLDYDDTEDDWEYEDDPDDDGHPDSCRVDFDVDENEDDWDSEDYSSADGEEEVVVVKKEKKNLHLKGTEG